MTRIHAVHTGLTIALVGALFTGCAAWFTVPPWVSFGSDTELLRYQTAPTSVVPFVDKAGNVELQNAVNAVAIDFLRHSVRLRDLTVIPLDEAAALRDQELELEGLAAVGRGRSSQAIAVINLPAYGDGDEVTPARAELNISFTDVDRRKIVWHVARSWRAESPGTPVVDLVTGTVAEDLGRLKWLFVLHTDRDKGTKGPLVTILSPSNKSQLEATSTDVRISITDLLGLRSIRTTNLATNFTRELTLRDESLESYRGTLAVPLAPGSNEIEVAAENKLGGITKRSVRVNATPPLPQLWSVLVEIPQASRSNVSGLVAALRERPSGSRSGRTQFLKDRDATRQAILKQLELARVSGSPSDARFFFYSGRLATLHRFSSRKLSGSASGDLLFIASADSIEPFASTWLELSEVIRGLGDVNVSGLVDACVIEDDSPSVLATLASSRLPRPFVIVIRECNASIDVADILTEQVRASHQADVTGQTVCSALAERPGVLRCSDLGVTPTVLIRSSVQ